MTRIAHCTREDLHQSRSFLMEIFGKLEKILAGVKDDEEVAWHPRLLQTIVHYMQGSLSYILGDLPHAENELKAGLFDFSGPVLTGWQNPTLARKPESKNFDAQPSVIHQ